MFFGNIFESTGTAGGGGGGGGDTQDPPYGIMYQIIDGVEITCTPVIVESEE